MLNISVALDTVQSLGAFHSQGIGNWTFSFNSSKGT